MVTRRRFLKGALGWMAIGSSAALVPRWLQAAELPAGTIAASVMERLPGKRPLIKRTYRPINYETPIEYLNDVITPNNLFFVRWHLGNVPEINNAEWRLRIAGTAASRPYELTLEQLKNEFEQVELTAVCQCGGNRRGLSEPHVPGIQWGNGAMGNAKWKGVRLKDVLDRAGVGGNAIEVAFDGADEPVYEKTPDFVKSLPIAKALDANTLIAFEMNSEPLPHLNGGPARIVVPGWIATYWVKKITGINVVSEPTQSFWMNTAYRTPKGLFPTDGIFTSQEKGKDTVPVTEMVINSLITNTSEGQQFHKGNKVTVRGIAWDAGYGIQKVEVSLDDGKSWQNAELGRDHGRYSFRQWEYAFTTERVGKTVIMARATNMQGMPQPVDLIFNPAGYHNNVVQRVSVEVV